MAKPIVADRGTDSRPSRTRAERALKLIEERGDEIVRIARLRGLPCSVLHGVGLLRCYLRRAGRVPVP